MTEKDFPNLLGKKILLVDDDDFVRQATESFLHSYGLEVEAVPAPQSALEAFATKKIDLVVLDLNLPGIGGSNTYKSLRQRSSDTPIIICSGDLLLLEENEFADEMDRDQHLKFLQKPYDPEKFILTISVLIR